MIMPQLQLHAKRLLMKLVKEFNCKYNIVCRVKGLTDTQHDIVIIHSINVLYKDFAIPNRIAHTDTSVKKGTQQQKPNIYQ